MDANIRDFESRVEKIPLAGCWLWTDSLMKGYGRAWIPPNSVLAHRLAWSLYRGPIPEDLWVLHRCDVRSCVNPEHLFLGNAADNARDMVNKGRNYVNKPTHCKRGHLLSEDNLYRHPRINQNMCKKCKKVHAWASNNNTTFDYAWDLFKSRGLV